MKNKEKCNFNEIRFSSTDTFSGHTFQVLCKNKVIYERTYLADTGQKKLTDFFNWLEQEYKPPILDDVEKAYLSAVIKPFRDRVKYITKYIYPAKEEYLLIVMYNGERMSFPTFKKETMYKGMKVYEEYTLEDLGL
nr:MAG TPA: hypothetical protein [Siphoviridae sp. ctWyD10]